MNKVTPKTLAAFENFKIRLKNEGSEAVTNCDRLKMIARD
jgi:hypothetical protein